MSSLAAVRDQIQAAIGGLTQLEESQQILAQAEGLQKDIAELEHEKQDLILDICDAREELNVLSREAARVRSDLSQSQSEKEIEKVADETTKPQSTDNKKEQKGVSFWLESQAEEGDEETQDVSFLPETQMQVGGETAMPFQLEPNNKKEQNMSFRLESLDAEDGDEETQDVSFLPETQMQAEEETQGSPFQLETQQQDASEDNEETQDVSFVLETQKPTTEDNEETQDASFLLENQKPKEKEEQEAEGGQDKEGLPEIQHNPNHKNNEENSDVEMADASDRDTTQDTTSPEQEHNADAEVGVTSEDAQMTNNKNEQQEAHEGHQGPTRMIDDVDVREVPVQETDYSGDDEGDGPQVQPVTNPAAARKMKRVRRVYRSPKTWRRMARNNRLRSVFLGHQGNDLSYNN